jgi:hypothetical protein
MRAPPNSRPEVIVRISRGIQATPAITMMRRASKSIDGFTSCARNKS